MRDGDEFEAVAGLLTAVGVHPGVESDSELLQVAAGWEAIGRLVDARRVAVAGEIQWRSREQLGDGGLARRQGCRNGAELLARVTRTGVREAQHRISLGIRVRPRTSLLGEELPSRYPAVTAALTAGAIGMDSARVIVEALAATARRAKPGDVVAAEAALVASAGEVQADLVRVQSVVWQARIDPDGAEPTDRMRQRARSFRLGFTGADGMARHVIVAPAEETAVLRGLLTAHRRGVNWQRQPCEDCEDDSEWHEAATDARTTAQFDFDTVMGVLRAGIQAEQDGAPGGAAPWEVVVQTTAADLEQGRGAGWVDGILARIPIPAVERMRCSGGTRLLVLGDNDEPLNLGKRVRLFSTAQRRVLAARDGGCAFPGCTAPAAWTEAHHIRWYERDDGPTDINNGVLLCSFHHHLIHTTDEWEIRLHEHAPHLVPKRWRGAPLKRHRMQQHPMRAASRPPGGAPPGGG